MVRMFCHVGAIVFGIVAGDMQKARGTSEVMEGIEG
jgi:hypothetical protein